MAKQKISLKPSFTLIELLVVIAVIGLLSQIVLVNVNKAREKAEFARVLTFWKQVPQMETSDGAGIMAENEVLHFSFSEGSGNIAHDTSGNGNDGTIYGATATWVDTGIPALGTALKFKNSSDKIELASPYLDLGTYWTIETWFLYPLEETSHWRTLTRGNGGDHQIIVRQNSYDLGTYDNTGHTGFHDSGYDMNNLSEGWHHLIAVQDGTNIIFYIDGKQVGIVSNYISTTDIRSIGNYWGGGQEWGTIDEFRVYNKALTVAQIQKHYTQGLSRLLAKGEITNQEYRDRLKIKD